MVEQSGEPAGSIHDANELSNILDEMTASTREFERVFATTISQAITKGNSFEKTLQSIGLKLAEIALKSALAPVEKSISGFVGSIFSTGVGNLGSSIAGTNPLSSPSLGHQPVSSLPPASVPSIVFNVQTNDAASFRKSETQVSSMLARAVGRGQRGL